MSSKIYLESICDKCGTQTRDAYSVATISSPSGPVHPPMPHGWCSVKLGAEASLQLCKQCAGELRVWLGLRTEAERISDSVAADNGGHGR
jgi:hypothetical protein